MAIVRHIGGGGGGSLSYMSYLSVSTPSSSQSININDGIGFFDKLDTGVYNEVVIHFKSFSLGAGETRTLRFGLYDTNGVLIIQSSRVLSSANNNLTYIAIPFEIQNNAYPIFAYYNLAINTATGGGQAFNLRGESATAENDANWLYRFPLSGAFPANLTSLTRSSLNFKPQLWLRFNSEL